MPVQRTNPHRNIPDAATLEAAETLTRMRAGQLPGPRPASTASAPGTSSPQGPHPFRPGQWHTLPPDVIRMNPAYREAIRDMQVHDFLARHASLMRSGHGNQARAISDVAHSIPPALFRNPGLQPVGSNPPPGFRDGPLRHPLERQYPNYVDPGVAAARASRTPVDHPMNGDSGSSPGSSPLASPFPRSVAPSPNQQMRLAGDLTQRLNELNRGPQERRNPGPPPNSAAPTPGGILMPVPVPVRRNVRFADTLANLENQAHDMAPRSPNPELHPPIPAAIAWHTVPPSQIRENPRFRESIRGMSVEAFLTHHQRLMNSRHPEHAQAMSQVVHTIPRNEFTNPGRRVRVDGPLIHPLMEPPANRPNGAESDR